MKNILVVFSKVFQFYGLIPSEYSRRFRFRSILFIFVLQCSLISSSVVKVTHAETFDDIMKEIIYLPTMVLSVCCTINVLVNATKIVDLMERLKVLFDDPESDFYKIKAFKQAFKFFKYFGTATTVSTILVMLGDFINQKLYVDIWMPSNYYVFLVMFLMQTCLCFIYIPILCFILTMFPSCAIVIIRSYAEFLQLRMRSVKDRESLIKWIDYQLNFNE